MRPKHLLALLPALFCLWGCTADMAYDFDTVYAVIPSADRDLTKYSLLTGTTTPLCPDPVCTHQRDDGCMFTAVTMLTRIPEGVCFVRDGEVYQDSATGEQRLPQSIVRYDYGKGEVDVLCTVNGTKYEGLQGRLIPTEKYVYYSVRAADDTKEVYDLWRVSAAGGKPESMGITTAWVASGVVDDWAWYGDVTGIYRIHLRDKTVEYLLENGDGVTTALYFFDDGGAWCVESGAEAAAVLYVQAGKAPVRLIEGEDIGFMVVSGDTLCCSDGEALFTVSRDGGEPTLLYQPEPGVHLSGLWSCGLGFAARVLLPDGTEQILPFNIREST